MPRAFNREQQQAIRETLLESGRELFARLGLRRTTVRDLARAAGIAQGSFYKFYGSKEDLFFEILEGEEQAFFAGWARELQARPLTRRRLKRILIEGFERFRDHPFLGSLLARGEYAQLRRHIPDSQLRDHIEGEIDLMGHTVRTLRRQGLVRTVDPKLLVAMLHAFFLLLVHQEDFALLSGPVGRRGDDDDLLPRLIDLMAGLVADHLATSGAANLRT